MGCKQRFSNELELFSDWIRVPEGDIHKARQVSQKIYTWIQQQSKFRIDRLRHGGSFAKGTSTFLKLDVDLVCYVQLEENFETTSDVFDFLQEVRDDWKQVLMHNTNLSESDLSKGKFAVKFELDGFQFDLCPAINFSRDLYEPIYINVRSKDCNDFVKYNDPASNRRSNYGKEFDILDNTSAISQSSKKEIIMNCLLTQIRPSPQRLVTKNFMPRLSQVLGPSQSEAAVTFVNEQSHYIKKLIRITKFWQQSVAYCGFKSGRSFLFECLAVRAGNEIEANRKNHRTPSLLDGLKKFLNYVKRLKKVRIDFEETWKKFRNKEDVINISKFGLFVPYDPNTNLLEDADNSFFKVFKDAAYRTTDRLYKFMNKRNTKFIIQKVFTPSRKFHNLYNLNQMEFSFWSSDLYFGSKYPTIKYESTFDEVGSITRPFIKQLHKMLASQAALNSYCWPNNHRASDNEKKLKQFIEKMIFSNQKDNYSSQTINLNDPCDLFDVLYCKKLKFTLPVKSPATKDCECYQLIEIDCDW